MPVDQLQAIYRFVYCHEIVHCMACKLVQLNLVGFINCQGAAEGSHLSTSEKLRCKKIKLYLITAD
jgi:hypothetical protein